MSGEDTGHGLLRVTITFMEMAARPAAPPPPLPPGKFALLRAEEPPLAFYRFLYDTVGEEWLWTERRLMAQEALRARLADPRFELYVLYGAGVPAGFFELWRDTPQVTDLALFGLMPEFIGRRLSPFLLGAAIEIAWSAAIERLTVNTCSFDHPRAFQLYQRAGFEPVRQEVHLKPDPRLAGVVHRDAARHIPIAAANEE